jgi:hypothetical protein
MVGALSLIGKLMSTAAAYFAERVSIYREEIETAAGILLIGGLMLLGSALPVIL